jgi:hypothetical protein
VNGDGTVPQILYGMSTNQGIQAFVVTVPEPASIALVAVVSVLTVVTVRRQTR